MFRKIFLVVIVVACSFGIGCDPCGRIIFIRDLAGPFDGCASDQDCIEGEVCDSVCETCVEPVEQ